MRRSYQQIVQAKFFLFLKPQSRTLANQLLGLTQYPVGLHEVLDGGRRGSLLKKIRGEVTQPRQRLARWPCQLLGQTQVLSFSAGVSGAVLAFLRAAQIGIDLMLLT